mgnify:CR=1
MVLEYEIIYSEITGIQFSGIVLKEGIWCVAKGCLWDKHVFAGDFDGYFLPFVGKQGIFITFYVVTGVFKILGVNRNIISKDEIGGITLGIKRNYYEVCKSWIYESKGEFKNKKSVMHLGEFFIYREF